MANGTKEKVDLGGVETAEMLARRALGEAEQPIVQLEAGVLRRSVTRPQPQAPRPPNPNRKPSRREERRAKRDAERGERQRAKAEKDAAHLSRHREYTGPIGRDSLIIGGGATAAWILGAGPYLAAPYAFVNGFATSFIALGAWTELVAGIVTVGSLVLATKIVPILAPVTNWLIQKTWRHTIGRAWHTVHEPSALWFDRKVSELNTLIENGVYAGLNWLSGPLKLGDQFKRANDWVKRKMDQLDGKVEKKTEQVVETKTA